MPQVLVDGPGASVPALGVSHVEPEAFPPPLPARGASAFPRLLADSLIFSLFITLLFCSNQ